MRIGELADRLGLNPRTVRYYEQIGLIPPAPRTAGGYRQYDDNDARRLVFIKTAQRLGLSLDEVAQILRLRDRGEPPCSYVRAVLQEQAWAVDRRIAELRSLRSELQALSDAADSLPENHGLTCRIIEHRPVEHRPLEHRPLEHRPLEHRPVGHRPVEHRPLEHRPGPHGDVLGASGRPAVPAAGG